MYIYILHIPLPHLQPESSSPFSSCAARQLRPVDALDARNGHGTAQRRVQALMEETEELSVARALGAEPKALETLERR